jgi:hypothetical protein
MKRETGEKVIAAMKDMDLVFKKIHDALLEIDDKEERDKLIKATVNVMSDGHVNIAMHVVAQFTDLHPDTM